MSIILETRNVSKHYGDYRALQEVSLSFREGEVVAIVGPNGAGKTTLVNLLTGLLKPTHGDVLFRGTSIAGVGPVRLAKLGMARAFQLVHIFPELTVSEAIASAVISQQNRNLDFWRNASTIEPVRQRVEEVARIFGLQNRLDWLASYLSQGEKKLLDIASAFALNPQLILLDEPTSGISTSDKRPLMDTLMDAAKKAGIKTMLLVEHDMDLVSEYSTRIIALTEGRVLADLPPKEFFADPHLAAAIVGKPPVELGA
ncbi:ABC transporter ATP-binding protein [Lacisediminimonas sp.]|uniref:ABC transporter ATP-binding protein n=1 Tax=Lacisediminimonas sp. TaxID=3060582 RepID=UPI002715FC27|nr:ABC transporter ATP-binding protein [Lacisediminimonas sp.]MDO8299603.1 ABC transporter ATP-binding protein [Lacisediminimonas sp.]